MSDFLEKAENTIVLTTLFLSLVLILPFFNDVAGLPKIIVLAVGVTLVLLVKALKAFNLKKIDFAKGEFDLPLFVITLAYTLSAIVITPNKMEAFLFPGTATLIIGCFLLYHLIGRSQKHIVRICLFVSGIFISLVSVLSFAKAFDVIPQLRPLLVDSKLSLLGGDLPTFIFLAAVLPLGIGLGLKIQDFAKKTFFFVAAGIVLLGIAVSLFGMFPAKGQAISLPSLGVSWNIAFDTLKQSPLLGAGPGNYLSAFNILRPVSYNTTTLWPLRFTVARDFYLTLITETGLLGLAGLILLGIKLSKRRTIKDESLISLFILLILLAVFPAAIPHIVLLFVLLSLVGSSKEETISLSQSSKVPGALIAVPTVALIFAFYFFAGKALSAEANFKKSTEALNRNDAKATYELMRSAISKNTYVDRYHSAFAQVNIALAQNLAQKKDLSEDDKKSISQLIQEAIRQGKASVFLNPQRSGNWELLARIYQAIIPFAQGSDQFALDSYIQAVALDPTSPTLRIALGGVYYALERYDEAIDAFKLAVAAKSDLANAHYNLSAAYRENGEIDKAISEMNIVLTLVQKGSADETIAKTELEDLNKKKPVKANAQEGQSLTPPVKAPEPVITPPLELPQEATPPAAPST